MSKLEGRVLEITRGRNGRLFLGGGAGFDQAAFFSETPFTPTMLMQWVSTFESWAGALKKRNIPLLLLIAPEAQTVYAEDLPPNIIPQPKSPAEILIEHLSHIENLEIVWPKAALIEAKGGIDVYKKNDSHWSAYGAYIGYKMMMEKAAPYTKARPLSSDKIHYVEKSMIGDLGSMIEPEQRNDVPFVTIVGQPPLKIHTFPGISRSDLKHVMNPSREGSVMICRDSFYTEMHSFVAATFHDCWAYGSETNIHFDLVDKYRPDIFIFEIGERRLQSLREKPNFLLGQDIYCDTPPDENEKHLRTALNYYRVGQSPSVYETLKALNLKALTPWQSLFYALIAESAGDTEPLKQVASSVVDELPEHPSAHVLNAKAAYHRGDHKAYITSIAQAYQLAPENPAIIELHLFLQNVVDNLEAAIAFYETTKHRVQHNGHIHYWGALAYKKAGNDAHAKTAIDLAIKLNGNNATYEALSITLAGSEEVRTAI
jgi:hypothetical protein